MSERERKRERESEKGRVRVRLERRRFKMRRESFLRMRSSPGLELCRHPRNENRDFNEDERKEKIKIKTR